MHWFFGFYYEIVIRGNPVVELESGNFLRAAAGLGLLQIPGLVRKDLEER
jgi:hypothetical protein